MNVLSLGIGTAARGEDDAISRLLACHARIRRFCALAVKVSEAEQASPAELVEAASALVRYFGEALPLHVEDEEVSLIPRLSKLDKPHEIAVALEALSAEHRELDALAAALVVDWRAAMDQPRILRAESVPGRARRLQAGFEPHLILEEEALFPWARSALPGAELMAMRDEMIARRRRPGDARQ